jgi:protein tyrosine phosphatase (PTP) superfamily phosphohydrolase (DUF442 family)
MPSNSMENIYNFLQISDSIATSGQPTIDQFTTIKEAGYQIVVNLALPESPNALVNEKQIVEVQNMQYVNIPVIWENPTIENIIEFFHVLETNHDKKIFVHCAANKRVSAFIYLYRLIHQSISEEKARNDLHKLWVPNEIWEKFIQQVIAIE